MKMPEFATEQEMADFWDAHDSAEYADELEEVRITWEPDEDTCPRCSGEMNSTSLDVELPGSLTLHHAVRYECPTWGFVRLSPRNVDGLAQLEQRIRRYGLAGLILLNLSQATNW